MGRLAIQAARTAPPARSRPQSGGRWACLGPIPGSRLPVIPSCQVRMPAPARGQRPGPAPPGRQARPRPVPVRAALAGPARQHRDRWAPQAPRRRRAWSHRRPREVRRRRAPGRITPQIHVMLQHSVPQGAILTHGPATSSFLPWPPNWIPYPVPV